jgi:WD40 repeat protein
VFSAHSVLDVHDQFATSLGVSPEGTYLSVLTCDGCIKVIERESMKMLTSQKRNNLPTGCHAWFSEDQQDTTHIFTGSADYTYNLIKIPAGTSSILSLFYHFFFVLLVQVPFLLLLILSCYSSSSKPDLQ